MIYTIEQTMAYLEEEKIKPDDGVKKVLIPMLERIEKWIENDIKLKQMNNDEK